MNTKLIVALASYGTTLVAAVTLAVIGRINLMDLGVLLTPSLCGFFLAPAMKKVFGR